MCGLKLEMAPSKDLPFEVKNVTVEEEKLIKKCVAGKFSLFFYSVMPILYFQLSKYFGRIMEFSKSNIYY